MLRIVDLDIERFRSILRMKLEFSDVSNIVALCGQNNVGKTNTLRALSLFFHPDEYQREIDMPRIKNATGGAATHPKISITLYDDVKKIYYHFSRNLAQYSNESSGLEGYSYLVSSSKKINKEKNTDSQIQSVINKIEFVYIESINVLMPELVEKLTNDVIDVQYDKARFGKNKQELKECYDKYIDGLKEIMDSFAADISTTFSDFQKEWKVCFNVPKNSDRFRSLISDDVRLVLDDSGSVGIEDKGAGLQRLATILLQFEMLARIRSNKQIIVCIDEPDVYLHEGLQRKLNHFFVEKSKSMQLFLTTHSKVFINLYKMDNVFLISAKWKEQYSARKKTNIPVIETFSVDISNDDGYKRICNHLGIEQLVYEPLENYNILVEGLCDKKYLEELSKFFDFSSPNIISAGGATNIIKYLEFYNSFYQSATFDKKPRIRVIFDNDNAGREENEKVKRKIKQFSAIEVSTELLPNCIWGDEHFGKKVNNEIEDFVYPEVICELINIILKRANLNQIDTSRVCKNIAQQAFSSSGLLDLCEHEKNSVNPKNGGKLSFLSETSQKIKGDMAELLTLEGNIKLQRLLKECSIKYPGVEQYLRTICLSH